MTLTALTTTDSYGHFTISSTENTVALFADAARDIILRNNTAIQFFAYTDMTLFG